MKLDRTNKPRFRIFFHQFPELHPGLPGVPEGGPHGRVRAGQARVSAAAGVEAQPVGGVEPEPARQRQQWRRRQWPGGRRQWCRWRRGWIGGFGRRRWQPGRPADVLFHGHVWQHEPVELVLVSILRCRRRLEGRGGDDDDDDVCCRDSNSDFDSCCCFCSFRYCYDDDDDRRDECDQRQQQQERSFAANVIQIIQIR